MAFALLYNQSDLQKLADYFENAGSFRTTDRAEADAFLLSGLNHWSSAQPAPAELPNSGPDVLLLVIDGVFLGESLTLQRFSDLCIGIADRLGSLPQSYGGGPEYMRALAEDMLSTGIENYGG